MQSVAVIGGGGGGLAAAQQLASSGAAVTVYERSDRVGGMLRTEAVAGARIDVGVQLVSSAHTTLQDIAAQCGARDVLVRAPGRDALYRKDRVHPITYGSVASMATSSALPATLKLKMVGRYLPFLTSSARRLDANDPAGSGGAAHDTESIGAWGARELGRDFIELLVYPLLGAYYGAQPEETSAAVYHALARSGMDVHVLAATGGFGALAEALQRSLESRGVAFRLGVGVTRVEGGSSGVSVVTDDGTQAHDAAVVAVPAGRVAALVPGAELAVWLSRVRVQPTFTVGYVMDRPFPGDYFGLSFPRTETPGARVVALCVQRNKLGSLVPAGGDVLLAMPAPAAVPQLLTQSDDDIARTLLATLEEAVPGMSRRVSSAHVFRFDDGYTLFTPGSLQHIARFDEGWLPRGIALAGQYLMAPSVEGAMRSGVKAAQRLLRDA
jgi:oxygen-dependent protoporphyrinogen oxidase